MHEIYDGHFLLLAAQIVTFLTSLVGLFIVIRNKNAVHELSIRVDGRLSQLIENIKSTEYAAGKTAGVAEQKDIQNGPGT